MELSPVLVFVLVYNNSLVILGPSVWNGVNKRLSILISTVGQIMGLFTSFMKPIKLDFITDTLLLAYYFVFNLFRLSLPISIFVYSVKLLSLRALLLWLTTPLISMALTPLFMRVFRSSARLHFVALFITSWLFSANNISVLTTDEVPKTVYLLAIIAGVALGVRFSSWILELYGVSQRASSTANASTSLMAFVGTLFQIPMSFTLLVYSSLIGASAFYKIRIVKICGFIKAYLAVLFAVILAFITPSLVQLLRHLIQGV